MLSISNSFSYSSKSGLLTFQMKGLMHEVYTTDIYEAVAVSIQREPNLYDIYYDDDVFPLEQARRIAFGKDDGAFAYHPAGKEELVEMFEKIIIDYASWLMDRRIMR